MRKDLTEEYFLVKCAKKAYLAKHEGANLENMPLKDICKGITPTELSAVIDAIKDGDEDIDSKRKLNPKLKVDSWLKNRRAGKYLMNYEGI